MNERFVGVLPFEIRSSKVKKIIYSETIVCICEHTDRVHAFEVNEFYNIINHQEFRVFDKERELFGQSIRDVQIFDAAIKDDIVYVLSANGLTKYDVFSEEKKEQ